ATDVTVRRDIRPTKPTCRAVRMDTECEGSYPFGICEEKPMRALVTVASRHNATLEIGEVVADTIREHGIECDLIVPEDVTSVAEYDVVIVGSAIYTGRWLPEARELVERLTAELQTKTVWLFSSGLADAPAKGSNRPAETHERMIASG